MFTCVLSDSGLSYSAETVQKVSEKLHEYIKEVYGDVYVDNLRTGSTYARCNIISSPGDYIIHPSLNPTNEIYCTIS